jgi:hypothetical protein
MCIPAITGKTQKPGHRDRAFFRLFENRVMLFNDPAPQSA